jgi:hypothetical protein
MERAMLLRDHFHLPLRGLCTWESFHSGWANEIVRQLSKSLPSAYVARPKMTIGRGQVLIHSERLAVPVFAGVAILLFGICLGAFAGENKQIPLGSIYTTTGQKDTKDAAAELKNVPQPHYSGLVTGAPVIFLVNGKDFGAAYQGSRRSFQVEGDPKAAAPKAVSKAGELNWVGAFLGSDGSSPPAYRVLSVAIQGRKVRVTYETIKRVISTGDEHPYLLWAPLGKLSPGEYTLELYEATTQKVTASRKSKVVE